MLVPVAAHADARTSDVIGLFQKLCTGDSTSVAAIGQKAAAMQMQAGQSANQPSGAGGTVSSQTWQGSLASGPISVIASQTSDQRGTMITCGVSASDITGSVFQPDLASALQLGKPTSVAPVPNNDGVTLSSWNGAFGPNTVLQLIQATTENTPGIMVSAATKTR